MERHTATASKEGDAGDDTGKRDSIGEILGVDGVDTCDQKGRGKEGRANSDSTGGGTESVISHNFTWEGGKESKKQLIRLGTHLMMAGGEDEDVRKENWAEEVEEEKKKITRLLRGEIDMWECSAPTEIRTFFGVSHLFPADPFFFFLVDNRTDQETYCNYSSARFTAY